MVSSGNESVTHKIEIRNEESWFDDEGSMTLIDCPGLAQAEYHEGTNVKLTDQ